MALLVLDASLAIAYLDGSDAHHERATSTIAESKLDERVLPASAYSELLVRAYRGGPAAVTEVELFIADLAIRIHPVDASVARRAAELRARHASVRLPDALVLATADVLDGIAITADRAWTRVSRRARVI